MITAGVVLDRWKLPIFKRHLDAAGFEYSEHPGVTSDTMLLKVKADFVATVQPIIEAAQRECRTQ